jgi:hypothetical protein
MAHTGHPYAHGSTNAPPSRVRVVRFLKEWAKLLLVGDAWLGRILRWLALAALLGIGVFLNESLTITVQKATSQSSVGVASGILLGLVWLSVTAGLAWARTGVPEQTPAYLKHLDDIQEFVKEARDRAKDVAVRIDMSNAMGGYFRSHYPDAAAKLDRWNTIDELSKTSEFWKVMRQQEESLGLMGNAVPMLASLAKGELEFDHLAWSVENQTVVVKVRDILWQVAERPQGNAFEDIKREVRNHVGVLRELREVTDLVDAMKQIEENVLVSSTTSKRSSTHTDSNVVARAVPNFLSI